MAHIRLCEWRWKEEGIVIPAVRDDAMASHEDRFGGRHHNSSVVVVTTIVVAIVVARVVVDFLPFRAISLATLSHSLGGAGGQLYKYKYYYNRFQWS